MTATGHNIALLAAVPFETELLRKELNLSPCDGPAHFDTFSGANDISLLHTGVGKANAASAATALLAQTAPRALILCGCGGAYPQSGLRIGDLAVATLEIFADEGVQTPGGFNDMAAIQFPLLTIDDAAYFNRLPVDTELTARLLPLITSSAARRQRRCADGPFVTVSTCSGTDRLSQELESRTGGICENMEGAAVAAVCLRYGIPFIELRGISNLTGDRDLSSWDLIGASEIAQQTILDLLSKV